MANGNLSSRSFWGSVWSWTKSVAKGDVAGAVAGAGAVLVVNAIPGAGQVAYGTSVAGWAAGCIKPLNRTLIFNKWTVFDANQF